MATSIAILVTKAMLNHSGKTREMVQFISLSLTRHRFPMFQFIEEACFFHLQVRLDNRIRHLSISQTYSTCTGCGGKTRRLTITRACKMFHAASGGVTHFALCIDEDDASVMTIAW